jgi:hypothetical protein
VALRVGVGVTVRVAVAAGDRAGVAVADVEGVRVGDAVGPGIWLPVLTTSSTRLLPASEELKAKASELVVSRAIDTSEPLLPARAEVTSI